MGDDDDIIIGPSTSHCGYACDKRDCDGDFNTFCMKSGYCPYKRNVRDCDGDFITMCGR